MNITLKNYITLFFIAFIGLLGSSIAFSQDCVDYYKQGDCEKYNKKDFYLTTHSRSTLFEINVESEIKAALSGGYDYIISCCTDREFYPIHMQILSEDESEILYDNLYDDYINSIGFTLDNSQILIIKVKLLAKDIKPEDFDENRACVGVTVQYRKTPKIGFN